ncbi:hypothetical protein SUGI_1489460 [Cryptomeria japonica]|uniref:Uncharacterized protein n=1 Tax=Cryptomeria japonica TaxID=3369 RepID=A0AAD3NVG2_CRYJA|nr:hypothetical protein SUGI_1489460 [Cryptomeria japonica]
MVDGEAMQSPMQENAWIQRKGVKTRSRLEFVAQSWHLRLHPCDMEVQNGSFGGVLSRGTKVVDRWLLEFPCQRTRCYVGGR